MSPCTTLWHRLLRRSASEYGTLCPGPKEGANHFRRPRTSGDPVQVPDSHSIPTSIPSEFPRIAFSGRALGQDEIDAAIQTTSTSKVRRVEVVAGPRNQSGRGVSDYVANPVWVITTANLLVYRWSITPFLET